MHKTVSDVLDQLKQFQLAGTQAEELELEIGHDSDLWKLGINPLPFWCGDHSKWRLFGVRVHFTQGTSWGLKKRAPLDQ